MRWERETWKLIKEVDIRYKEQFKAHLPTESVASIIYVSAQEPNSINSDLNNVYLCMKAALLHCILWKAVLTRVSCRRSSCCGLRTTKPAKLWNFIEPMVPWQHNTMPANVVEASDCVFIQQAPAWSATGTTFNNPLLWFFLEQDKTQWWSLLTSIGLPGTQTSLSCLLQRCWSFTPKQNAADWQVLVKDTQEMQLKTTPSTDNCG